MAEDSVAKWQPHLTALNLAQNELQILVPFSVQIVCQFASCLLFTRWQRVGCVKSFAISHFHGFCMRMTWSNFKGKTFPDWQLLRLAAD